MPWKLDGNVLPSNQSFKDKNGTQYPANWITLASPSERAAIGLTWEDPPTKDYDSRFYKSKDTPKDLGELKKLYILEVNCYCAASLKVTDWYVTRAADPSSGKAVPDDIKTERTAFRTKAADKETKINACSDVPALKTYVTGQDYFDWPTTDARYPT